QIYSLSLHDALPISLISPTETPTKYQDFNTRNLLEWQGFYGKFISTLRLAYITENYKYFQNIEKSTFSFGEATSYIGKYQLDYRSEEHTSELQSREK